RPDLAPLHQARLDAVVARVVPVRRVALEPVGADARDAGRRRIAAIGAEEPQPILLDWTADRAARVVGALDAGAAGDALAARRGVDVVAARPVAGGVEERLPGEFVAARFLHDVHRGAAGLVLAEAARDDHHDLFGVAGVVGERRHAAAVERRRDGHAVDRHPPFVGAAAVRA